MLWGARGTQDNRCYTNSPAANWTRFTTLLRQATKACREVCPEAKVILHSERSCDPTVLLDFMSRMQKAGVDYDVLGLSYYPYFHGTISELEGAIKVLERDYADKDIMVVEFGYPYAWEVPGTTYKYPNYFSKYAYSDEGQKTMTADVIAMLNKHKNVNGLFWWWMEYNAKDSKLSESWYNAPLFDSRTGKATSALYELKNFVNDPTAISHVTTDKAAAKDAAWYTLDGKKVDKPGKRNVYINNHRKIVCND